MAEGTVLEFQADLKGFFEAIGVTVAEGTKRVVLQAHNGMIEKIPVLTGRLRGSLGISLDTPGDYELPEGEYGPDGGAARAKAQQRNLDELTEANPYREVWIFSNLEYASIIETGTSAKAPLGYAAVTLAEVAAEIDALLEAVAQEHLTEK